MAHKALFGNIWDKKIDFPSNLVLIKDDGKNKGKKNKIILFIKPDCSTCITKMNDWKEFLSKNEFPSTECAFVTLGKLNSYFTEFTSGASLPFTIYLDSTSRFFYLNNLAEYYNTPLLLNGENRVVMAGDPEANPNILELYRYAISKN